MKAKNLVLALVVVGGIVIVQKTHPLGLFARHFDDDTEYVTQADHDFDFAFDFDNDTSEDRDVMIDETFSVSSGGDLYMDIEHSNLVVETGSNREAHVRVVLEGSNMERAREFYDSLNFEAEKTRNGVSVTADRDNNRNWNWNSKGRVEITTFVTVPREFNYEIRLSHGNARLPDIVGQASIAMSHGNLDVDNIEGGDIEIRLSHGNLEAGSLGGEMISLRSSHGNVDVRAIGARETDAKLSHGNLRIESVEGAIRVDNSHGNIEVSLNDSAGSRFSNSHGDIDIVASEDFAANVDFRGDRVRMSSDLNFQGSVKDSRAEGRINGGGADIVARTSHGSISLRRR